MKPEKTRPSRAAPRTPLHPKQHRTAGEDKERPRCSILTRNRVRRTVNDWARRESCVTRNSKTEKGQSNFSCSNNVLPWNGLVRNNLVENRKTLILDSTCCVSDKKYPSTIGCSQSFFFRETQNKTLTIKFKNVVRVQVGWPQFFCTFRKFKATAVVIFAPVHTLLVSRKRNTVGSPLHTQFSQSRRIFHYSCERRRQCLLLPPCLVLGENM